MEEKNTGRKLMATKEELKKRHHAYYEANKEKIYAKTKAYAQTKKGKEIAKANYQKSRKKRLAYQKDYQSSPRGKEVARAYWQRKKLRIQNEVKPIPAQENKIVEKKPERKWWGLG
jgi:hypothetical protein